ncbi:MAG: hypothetical protein WC595_01545 [Candidatus Nanoarchaeia archaeon]
MTNIMAYVKNPSKDSGIAREYPSSQASFPFRGLPKFEEILGRKNRYREREILRNWKAK